MDEVLAPRRDGLGLERIPRAVATDLQAREALTWPITGDVYGVALNAKSELAALDEVFHAAPHARPPIAPVLYIKSVNTLAASGAQVVAPAGIDHLDVRASLVIVIGRTACRVPADKALDYVQGYAIALDASLPQADYFRPAVRELCRDGFLPIGPWITPRSAVASPDALTLSVNVDGEARDSASTADMVRSIPTLIADITDFMTLRPGDVLMTSPLAPTAVRVGQTVAAEIAGLGRLDCRIARGDAA